MQSVNRITFSRSTSSLLSYCRRFLTCSTSLDPGGGRDTNCNNKLYSSYCCRRRSLREGHKILIIPTNYYHNSTSRKTNQQPKFADDDSNEWGVQGLEKYVVNKDTLTATSESGLPAVGKYAFKWQIKKKKKERERKAHHRTLPEYKQIKRSTYDDLVWEFPQLGHLDDYDVQQLMADAAVYGFSPTKIAKMLCRYPQLLENYTELLPGSAKAWRIFGLVEKDRVAIFVRNPQLMRVPVEMVHSRYRFLSEFFSKKELQELVQNNPRIVAEDENLLGQKMNLLWKEYSHSTLNIANSDCLSHNLKEITVRHEILIRAGLFKPMPFHKFLKMQGEDDARRYASVRDKYHLPLDIVCTSDQKFLRKCTNDTLTATDLYVFEEILDKESLNKHYDDLDEFEGSDDEDNDVMTTKSQNDAEEGKIVDEEDSDEEEEDQMRITDLRYRSRNSDDLFTLMDSIDAYF